MPDAFLGAHAGSELMPLLMHMYRRNTRNCNLTIDNAFFDLLFNDLLRPRRPEHSLRLSSLDLSGSHTPVVLAEPFVMPVRHDFGPGPREQEGDEEDPVPGYEGTLDLVDLLSCPIRACVTVGLICDVDTDMCEDLLADHLTAGQTDRDSRPRVRARADKVAPAHLGVPRLRPEAQYVEETVAKA